jgi:hypothetical protein
VRPEDKSAIDTDFSSCDSELRANLTRHSLALKEEGRLYRYSVYSLYWYKSTNTDVLMRSYRDKHDRGDIKGGMWAIDERIRIVARAMPAEARTPELLYEVNPKCTCFH